MAGRRGGGEEKQQFEFGKEFTRVADSDCGGPEDDGDQWCVEMMSRIGREFVEAQDSEQRQSDSQASWGQQCDEPDW